MSQSDLLKQNINKGTYPKLKGLKFAHLNITSLPKHLDELKLFLQQVPFEILSLNETRLLWNCAIQWTLAYSESNFANCKLYQLFKEKKCLKK